MLSDGKVYQDVWIKGRVVLQSGLYDKEGNKFEVGPQCAPRYEVIKKALPKKAHMYVVDIGASLGYFGVRIATDWPDAQILAIEQRDLEWQHQIAKANGVDDRWSQEGDIDYWLEQGLKKKDLPKRTMVLLLFNVLHHLPNWEDVVAEIPFFDYVFFMNPQNDDTGSEHIARARKINAMMTQSFEMKSIGEFPSHRSADIMRTMWLIRNKS